MIEVNLLLRDSARPPTTLVEKPWTISDTRSGDQSTSRCHRPVMFHQPRCIQAKCPLSAWAFRASQWHPLCAGSEGYTSNA